MLPENRRYSSIYCIRRNWAAFSALSELQQFFKYIKNRTAQAKSEVRNFGFYHKHISKLGPGTFHCYPAIEFREVQPGALGKEAKLTARSNVRWETKYDCEKLWAYVVREKGMMHDGMF